MSNRKKRIYISEARDAQAVETKKRILLSAKKLFQIEGFECVTIEKLAQTAEVSAPTIYALFQSKRGVLLALMDEALDQSQFDALVGMFKREKSAKKRLALSAKIARQMYDAEKAQIDIFSGAAVLAPEFKELEKEREQRRYQRQEEGLKIMAKEKSLKKGLSITKARDLLWAFTGRDMYRMLVVERGWTSNAYEKWLTQLLIEALLVDGR